jgi:hypothetical protein
MQRKKKSESKSPPKIRWQKSGGGSFRMADGRIIKSKEIFLAHPEEIPAAFMDSVKPLDPVRKKKPSVTEPEKGAKALYTKKERSKGWWDIVDSKGKKMNDRALREAEADELINTLEQ